MTQAVGVSTDRKPPLCAAHIFPTSLKASEWTVLHDTFLGKRRSASLVTDLLKDTYRKWRSGLCSAYRTSVVVFPVPAGQWGEDGHAPVSGEKRGA